MGTTRDFFVSALADTLLPIFHRSMEDTVYEILDQRQVPSRTDFKELRDLVNGLRGQVSGTTGAVERLAKQDEDFLVRLDALDAKLEQMSRVASKPAAASARKAPAKASAKRKPAKKAAPKAAAKKKAKR